MKAKDIENILCEINSIQNLNDLNSYAEKILAMDIFYKDSDIVSNAKVMIKNFLCKFLMSKAEKFLSTEPRRDYPSLNNILSKNLFNAKKLEKILINYPGIDREIGCIPEIFFSKIKNKDKERSARKIFSVFSEFAMRLNYDYDLDYDDYDIENNKIEPATNDFENELSKIINQKVKLKYHNCGYNGNGFKLTIGNKNFFYKVFFLYNSDDMDRYYNHGGLAEPQMALFANKNSRKDKFAKFYFGKVAYRFYIDSFIVTDFLERTPDFQKQEKLQLDLVKIGETELHKFDNTINGKIVDFGGIRICIPELTDKNIRKVVRIICNFIHYSYDDKHFSSTWQIKAKKLQQFKQYVEKCNKDLYKKAIGVIKRYKNNFPLQFAEILENMQYQSSEILVTDTLMTKHIFLNRIDDIIKNAEYYNLTIKNKQEPIPEFNSPGYVIIGITDNIQCVCFFNNNVTKIRIEELDKNKLFNPILELNSPDEIARFKNIEFYKLL